MPDVLYVVIPCYNEQDVLRETNLRVKEKLARMMKEGLISENSRILYVDDGSKDQTWEIIEELHGKDPHVEGIKLTRNRGHQNALLAGLTAAKDHCDICISMDADLQDDIEVLDDFVQKYHDGNDIVYGVRSSRKTDSFFKRNSALAFYKLLKAFGVEAVYNHADYRLMSKKALDGLAKFGEVNLFLRGIVPMIGYKTDTVVYARGERLAGESKYPLKKMLGFAFEGITSFSIKPVRIITAIGLVVFLISLCCLIYTFAAHGFEIISRLILESVWLLGGLQLAAVGLVGEYVGKTYMEAKKRPRYIIEKILGASEPKDEA